MDSRRTDDQFGSDYPKLLEHLLPKLLQTLSESSEEVEDMVKPLVFKQYSSLSDDHLIYIGLKLQKKTLLKWLQVEPYSSDYGFSGFLSVAVNSESLMTRYLSAISEALIEAEDEPSLKGLLGSLWLLLRGEIYYPDHLVVPEDFNASKLISLVLRL